MPVKPILDTEDKTMVLCSYDIVVLGMMGNTKNENRQENALPILRT